MAERGLKLSDKVCKVCGATFTPNTPSKICCSKECSKENTRIMHREYLKGHRKEQQLKKPNNIPYKDRPGVCDRFCDGCVFLAWANSNTRVCEYFVRTGQRRPCPAGTGCTVKSTGKKKTLWQHQSDQSWNHKQKMEAKAVEIYHKVCACCGEEFETHSSRQIYCSNKCKNRATQMAYHHRKKPELTFTCVICGKQFTSTDARRKCCSPECTKENRKLHDMNRGKRNGKEKQGVNGPQ